MEIIYNLEEITKAAKFILDNAAYKVILFKGEMGGGKTTLIRALTKAIGSDDLVSSPTFSIVNEYHFDRGSIFHFDMYRIDNENEIINIGFDEYLEFGSWVFIEWPEKIPNLLPEKFSKLHINIIDNNNRKLTLENN
mgnify:FL=1